MIIAFFIVSIFLALVAYLIKNREVSIGVSLVHALLVTGLTMAEYTRLDVVQNEYFRVDHLGIIFLTLLSVLGFISTLQYRLYQKHRKESPYTVRVRNGIYILFITALVGINISNHFGLLWAFIEATTLSGAFLIMHDRDKRAIEGVWKYVFVASISVALAFTGILFLSLAVRDANAINFSFDAVGNMAPTMDPVWLKACFLFILVGFSVKMGLVPMFNVDIDAKDVAPSPISAMFSSVMLNAGFLAIFRFYAAFSGTSILPWMQNVLIITGVLSILFSTAYLLKVKNYKRLLAYSSMEHAGLIILALAMGKAGYFAALLHIIFHSLVKPTLFYQVGQVHRVYNSKLEHQVGGYFFVNPTGGAILLLAVLSVIGLPTSGLFISELLIFKSLFASQHIWLAVLVMLLLIYIFYTMLRSIFKLLFIKSEEPHEFDADAVHPSHSFSQFLLLGSTVYLGLVQPKFFIEFINQAVNLLP